MHFKTNQQERDCLAAYVTGNMVDTHEAKEL
jgi:hypothetical protein